MNLHFTYYAFLEKSGIIVSQLWRKMAILSLLLFAGAISFAQQVTIDRTVGCSCVDNDAPIGQAQFLEELTVTSSVGETWYISSVSGLYQDSSPVPPEAQIPFTIGLLGDTLTTDGAGSYRLVGLHLEDLGYSIEVTNGVDTGRLDNILCAFPSAEILGDVGICEGETAIYEIANPNMDYTYSWSISGQGEIVGVTDGISLEVDWDDDGLGTEFVFVEVVGLTGCGQTESVMIEFEEDIILACNNQINISVSADCIIEVMPDDVLESMKYDDMSYEIVITDPATGNVVPQGIAASEFLFDTLEYSILHLCSNNSCWGNIVFEDKYVPPLTCENDTIDCSMDDSPAVLGFPLPNSAIVTSLGGNEYLVEGFDPCGDATLIYMDSEQDFSCDQPYSSVVSRLWTLTDFSGSTGTCTQTISKTRTTTDDVDFPGDWDGVTNPVLACDGTYPTLPDGNPDPSFTGRPSGGICDHLNISYVDLISEICGATYKVVRKWKVVDECTNTERTNNQLIKIEDNEAPGFSCPQDQSFYITQQNTCSTNISVSVPTNVTDCSGVNFTAEIVELDEDGNIAGLISEMNRSGGNFTAQNRVLGEHRITYTAIDECGFESSCSFSVVVLDDTNPIAICDLATTIALDNAGSAIVPVSTFDNGSFDNCSIDRVEISRGSNGCGASTAFSESITLCCSDANSDVMVTLRVTDHAGNSNTCMVMVSVQDKKAPIITCPANQSIPCNSDYSDLSQFGAATATDNCEVSISETTDIQVNNCGQGTIYRNFLATDDAGNTAACTQIINLVNNDPFVYQDIIWPADYSTNNCVSPELDPDDLPTNNSYPVLGVKPCSDPVFDYDDKVYTNSNGACQTIFRTWTVIDQCSGQDFEFTQKLDINDNQNPVFDECSNKVLEGAASDSNCEFSVIYSKSASDDCTAAEDLFISYLIDLNNSGTSDIEGTSSTINMTLPAGTHKVTWRAEDACNNVENCVEFITINDDKNPSPYCLGGISTVVMPSTGSIAIWASDFDLASTDNCTADEDLDFSFSPAISNTSITFTCEDLEGLDEKFFTLEVYVHDEAGNFDFCTTTVRITATTACDTSMTIMLGGAIYTEDEEKMSDVNMELYDMTQENSFASITNEIGEYAFMDLPMMMDYRLTPSYEGDYLNGITTLDIILIQKHILGLELFDSPYKVIAADVNNSESITGADIVQLRQMILGHFEEFPSNSSWRFVSAGQQFNSVFNPWPIEESIEVLGDDSYFTKDFVSVKVGDVNLSRVTEFTNEELDTRSLDYTVLEYEFVEKAEGRSVVFSSKESLMIYGLQCKFQGDFKEINSNVLDLNNSIYKSDESIAVSYSKASARKISKDIFSINLNSDSDESIQLAEVGMKNEIYLRGSEGSIVTSNLLLRKKTSENNADLIVYQNTPNPFNEYTEINFSNPKAEVVTLEIRSTDGLLLLKKSEFFLEGNQTIKIDKNDLPIASSGGVMIYTVINSTDRISNKMVAIK